MDHGHRSAPMDLDRPDMLAWLRRDVHEILDSHPEVSVGFFKAAERPTRSPVAERHEFEGVLQEAALAHGRRLRLERRIKTQVKSDTGFGRAARYITELCEHEALEGLSRANFGDALLAALCGLPRS